MAVASRARKFSRLLLVLPLGQMLATTGAGFSGNDAVQVVIVALLPPQIISSGGNSAHDPPPVTAPSRPASCACATGGALPANVVVNSMPGTILCWLSGSDARHPVRVSRQSVVLRYVIDPHR